MSFAQIDFTSKEQAATVEELRSMLTKQFGVTVVGPYLTVRWKNCQVSMTINDVDTGKRVSSKQWQCEARGKNILKQYCVYDPVADPMHDSCIYCGQPS